MGSLPPLKGLRKILVANRGEIALRIMRTCRTLGIETIAVYSDADSQAPHARFADKAVHIGEAPSRDSYLRIDRILAAARKTGADAIHPGYGFLAERAEFAEACAQAGIVFIGPLPEAIRKLGLKREARALAARIGLPVIPESNEFPLLIKASAGGGGRGMRVVHKAEEFAAALESAKREAEALFGDGNVFTERYIPKARHIEVQIFGDHHGNVIHLFERDCSIQRRHQKIVEESPFSVLNEALRAKICEAAVALGRAGGYTNAGTVEFLLSGDDFFFLEVNARIQVEHPVTEMTTGLDLIGLQIEVAEGRALPAQSSIARNGHAMQARLYAEDPENAFLPSMGVLHAWRLPSDIRIDSGVEQGMEISIYYDPLLAKLIAHGPDRSTALRKLVQALKHMIAHGPATNQDLLIRILESQAFQENRIHTQFLEEELVAATPPDDSPFLAALDFYRERSVHVKRKILPGVPPNYRNNPWRSFSSEERRRRQAELIAWEPGLVAIAIDGVQHRFTVTEVPGDEESVFYFTSPLGSRKIPLPARLPRPKSLSTYQTANSPMPGLVLRILVHLGQCVHAGDPLVVLEAMKMEQTIRTTINGIVEAVLVQAGQVVAPGQTLVQIGNEEQADVHNNR